MVGALPDRTRAVSDSTIKGLRYESIESGTYTKRKKKRLPPAFVFELLMTVVNSVPEFCRLVLNTITSIMCKGLLK